MNVYCIFLHKSQRFIIDRSASIFYSITTFRNPQRTFGKLSTMILLWWQRVMVTSNSWINFARIPRRRPSVTLFQTTERFLWFVSHISLLDSQHIPAVGIIKVRLNPSFHILETKVSSSDLHILKHILLRRPCDTHKEIFDLNYFSTVNKRECKALENLEHNSWY